MESLKIYTINVNYVKYLSQFHDHIFYSGETQKDRKYIGIVLDIRGYHYFVPLTSYKNKHEKMPERVDFIKIKDYAVLNINNMIPVPEGMYHLVNISSIKDKQYRHLLNAEWRAINQQKNRIYKNASIIYSHKLLKGNSTPLSARSYDFSLLEEKCKAFMS